MKISFIYKLFQRKYFLVIFAVLLVNIINVLNVKASHISGGYISYECQGNGKFVFSVHVYYDCTSSTTLQTNLNLLIAGSSLPTIDGVANAAAIPLNLIGETDISPTCNLSGPSISCSGSPVAQGAIKEYLFQSPAVTISGSIPTLGWTFMYAINFRTTNITNLSSVGSQPMVLYTTMYGFNGQIPNPCYDSSPQLDNTPIPILCSGTAVNYNSIAADPDYDEVRYSFAKPLYGDATDPNTGYPIFNPPTQPQEYPFASGYSFDNPMPDQSFDAQNIPATLDSITGDLTFRNYSLGTYIIATVAKSYRCGQHISTVYREFNVQMSGNCGGNQAPIIVESPNQSNTYNIEVFAGEAVNISLAAIDNDTLTNGGTQNVSVIAKGNQIGVDANSGCDNPPCATISSNLINDTTFTTLNWQTNCGHIATNASCMSENTTYNFSIIFSDDYCPIPSQTSYHIAVTVKPQPLATPLTVSVVSDSSCNFTATAAAGATFQWFRNGEIQIGANNANYTANQNGTYTVLASLITDSCTMGTASDSISCLNSSVEELAIQNCKLYPTFGNGHFILEFFSPQNANYTIEIKNTLGQTLSTSALNINQGTTKKTFDLQLPSGIYSCIINDSKSSTLARKFIVN